MIENVETDVPCPLQCVTELLSPHQHRRERHAALPDDVESLLRSIGDRTVGIDGRHFDGEVGARNTGEVGRQDQQIGRRTQRRNLPVEEEQEMEVVLGLLKIFELGQPILECQQDTRIDVE